MTRRDAPPINHEPYLLGDIMAQLDRTHGPAQSSLALAQRFSTVLRLQAIAIAATGDSNSPTTAATAWAQFELLVMRYRSPELYEALCQAMPEASVATMESADTDALDPQAAFVVGALLCYGVHRLWNDSVDPSRGHRSAVGYNLSNVLSVSADPNHATPPETMAGWRSMAQLLLDNVGPRPSVME